MVARLFVVYSNWSISDVERQLEEDGLTDHLVRYVYDRDGSATNRCFIVADDKKVSNLPKRKGFSYSEPYVIYERQMAPPDKDAHSLFLPGLLLPSEKEDLKVFLDGLVSSSLVPSEKSFRVKFGPTYTILSFSEEVREETVAIVRLLLTDRKYPSTGAWTRVFWSNKKGK